MWRRSGPVIYVVGDGAPAAPSAPILPILAAIDWLLAFWSTFGPPNPGKGHCVLPSSTETPPEWHPILHTLFVDALTLASDRTVMTVALRNNLSRRKGGVGIAIEPEESPILFFFCSSLLLFLLALPARLRFLSIYLPIDRSSLLLLRSSQPNHPKILQDAGTRLTLDRCACIDQETNKTCAPAPLKRKWEGERLHKMANTKKKI